MATKLFIDTWGWLTLHDRSERLLTSPMWVCSLVLTLGAEQHSQEYDAIAKMIKIAPGNRYRIWSRN